ncbi:acetolactate synthase [Blattabacterium cuenoti]|uniref:acetolactate synthase n=1 Tax=Blattabacterium cuenoti TaxID=1653831 RepID=UPI00163CF570|nr:acetolactate synthase [Blattabacterium cuenoti]
MIHKFRLVIIGENEIRLLNRILILISRRNLKINYINVSKKKFENNINEYLLDLECKKNQLIKLNKLINQLIGISHTYYYKKKISV